jgi:hypothetical protein
MPFGLSPQRAQQLDVPTRDLIDRLVDFTDAVSNAVVGMTGEWRATLRSYAAALLMREGDLRRSSQLRETMRVAGEGRDDLGVVAAVDNALRTARWDPTTVFGGIGAVAAPDVGNVLGTLVEELVIDQPAATSFGRHTREPTDRHDRPPYRRWRWLEKRAPPSQRVLIAGCVGATRSIVLGLRPSAVSVGVDGSQEAWEQQLVATLDGEPSDACAVAVVGQARAAVPRPVKEPPVVSVLCDEQGWKQLRRDLHARGTRYALPVPVDAGLEFVAEDRAMYASDVVVEALDFFEQHPSRPFIRPVHGIFQGSDPVPEWVVVAPRKTAQGYAAVWVIDRAGSEPGLEPVVRRIDLAMRVARLFDRALLEQLHASAWPQQRAAGWLRHLAIVAIAHAFVSVERPDPSLDEKPGDPAQPVESASVGS